MNPGCLDLRVETKQKLYVLDRNSGMTYGHVRKQADRGFDSDWYFIASNEDEGFREFCLWLELIL
jgi:hypothetical protein